MKKTNTTVRLGKRASWLPPLKEAVVLLLFFAAFTILFIIILYSGKSNSKIEIQRISQELKGRVELDSLLRGPAVVGFTAGGDIPGRTAPIPKGTTYAELIRMYVIEADYNTMKNYKDQLEATAAPMLNEVYGKKNWKLTIKASGVLAEFGEGGEHSTEAIIPSYDGNLIYVYLVTDE